MVVIWRRRRLRRRFITRVVVSVLAFAALAIATLPWWFPTSIIKKSLEGELEHYTRTEVKIERIEIGWASGVEIHNLTIASPGGFGGELVAGVERIHTEFNPLRLIFADEIREMTLDQPWVNAIFNEEGETNLTALANLEGDLEVRQITINDAEARFTLPDNEQSLDLSVNHARFESGRLANIGMVTVSAKLQQSEDPAEINLYVDSAVDENVAAKATFAFRDVDLGLLSLPKLLDLPLTRLRGRCSGSVDLQISDNGVVEEAFIELVGTDLKLAGLSGQNVPELDRASVRISASYDPLADGMIDLRAIDLQLAEALSVKGHGKASPDLLMGSSGAIDHLDLSIMLDPRPLALLMRGEPSFGPTRIDGPIATHITVDRSGRALTDYALQVDATDAAFHRGGHVLKPVGRPLGAHASGRYNDRNDLCVLTDWRVELGDNRLQGQGRIRSFRRWRSQWSEAMAGDVQVLLTQLARVQGSMSGEVADWLALQEMAPEAQGFWEGFDASGPARFNGLLQYDPARRMKFVASVPEGTALRLGDRFHKPESVAMTATIVAGIDPGQRVLSDVDVELFCGDGELSITNGTLRLPDADVLPAERIMFNGDLSARQVESFAACVEPPGTAVSIWPMNPAGEFRGQVHWRSGAKDVAPELVLALRDIMMTFETDRWDGVLAGGTTIRSGTVDGLDTLQINADDLVVVVESDQATRGKVAGQMLRATRTLDSEAIRWSVAFGGSEFALTQPTDAAQPIHCRAELQVDRALRDAAPTVADLHQSSKLSGQADVDVWVHRDRDFIRGVVDAGALTWDHDGTFVKSAEQKCLWDFTVKGDASGKQWIAIEDGVLGPIAFDARMKIESLARANGTVTISVDDAGALATIWPDLTDRMTAGKVQWDLIWTMAPDELLFRNTWDLTDLTWAHRQEAMVFSGPVSLDVAVHVGPDESMAEQIGAVPIADGAHVGRFRRFATDGLSYDIAGQRGFLVASIDGGPERLEGTASVLAEEIDLDALGIWLSGDRPVRPTEPTLTDEQMRDLEQRVAPIVDAVGAFTRDVDLRVDIASDAIAYYDLQVQQRYEARNFVGTITAGDGRIDVDYACGLNSGSLRRSYAMDFTLGVPEVHYLHVMDEVEAHKDLRPQIAYSFPGNTVTGLFSQARDWTMSIESMFANSVDYRYPMHPTGTSVSIAIEGIAEGQAAPEFITNIYPGLKTTQYPYERMTAFSEHLDDGTVISDMIFDGNEYDTYMEGRTDPDMVGEFEIGVILLNERQDPEWNHQYKQGRIPILEFEGRIEDGQMVDVEVTYPWPTESMYTMFLRNNYVYRSWKVKQDEKALLRGQDEESSDGP